MKLLFEPLGIASLHARNRMIRSATAESLCTKEGEPTLPLTQVYEQLSEGGIGTIITGFSYCTESGKPAERALSFCDPSPAMSDLVTAAHEHGAKIVLQLVYGGSKSKLATDDPRWLEAAGGTPCDGIPTADLLGPSAVVNPATEIVPREATPTELAQVVADFGTAAARARVLGFDGIEIHAAHGYMLSQFLSPAFNHRGDMYGGAIENRARIVCECIQEVRRRTAPDYPVLVKVNACDDFNDPAGLRGGLSLDESAQAAKLYEAAGASAIEVSGDWHTATKEVLDGQPFFGEFGARLARELSIPVIVTGGWRNPRIIEAHLAANGIAGIGLSRPLIREPHLALRWQADDLADSHCITCGICGKHAGIPCPDRQ